MDTWRWQSGVDSLRVFRRGAVPPNFAASALSPGLARMHLDDWLRSQSSRAALLGAWGIAALGPVIPLAAARRSVADALASGALIVVREARRRVIVPVADVTESLGPEPEVEVLRWLDVLLVDSTGAPLASQPYLLTLPKGAPPDSPDSLDGDGRVRKTDLDEGAAKIAFPKLDDRPGDTVPEDAPPFEPIEDAFLLTRRDDATRLHSLGSQQMPAGKGPTQIFQLTRHDAEVIELEHFNDRSAVLLPGTPPDDVKLRPGAPVVQGIDVLRACLGALATTPMERTMITGHGATKAKERADGVRALLTKDRDAWVGIALGNSRVADYQLYLRWASHAFGWSCDPGEITDADDTATRAAVKRMQAAYNEDLAALRFPEPNAGSAIDVDGIVGPQTWGAMFDGYMRALFPVGDPGHAAFLIVDKTHQTYPVKLAEISVGDANRWKDLNHLNKKMVRPNGGGWYPPQIGQRIYIPDDWNLVALGPNGAGYVTSPKAPPTPPPEGAVSPLAAPGPKTVACGAHHLQTPSANAPKRRATKRAVEVMLFGKGQVPAVVACGDGAGPCPAANCELYDPRDYALEYLTPDEASHLQPVDFQIMRLRGNEPAANVVAVILLPDGSLIERSTDAAGVVRLHGAPGQIFQLVRVVDKEHEEELVSALAATAIGASA